MLQQADTIRDLNTTSDKLSSLESAERALRERAESAEAELVCAIFAEGLLRVGILFSV